MNNNGKNGKNYYNGYGDDSNPASISVARPLVDLRDRTLQKSRIAFHNRVAAIERGADDATKEGLALLQAWEERFSKLEDEANEDIYNLIRDEPIVQDIQAIKGIGPILAAKLVSMVDISRSPTVSAFWRYCGYAVIDGAAERRTRGEKLHYSSRVRSTCYLIGSSFLKTKDSPYKPLYYDAKEYYQEVHPDWTKKHIHLAALRKMIKVFLCHLWEYWREMEGLETPPLYVMQQMGHTHKYDKRDFGWIVLD